MQPSAETTDGDLARAIAASAGASREIAEGELYRRFASRVRLYGLRHLRDVEAAGDLVQQVMLLTIEKLRDGSVRDADQIGSFILGVSRTIASGAKRRERRRERLLAAFTVTPGAEPPAGDGTLDADRLEACVAQLPERDRVVILLTFYGERTARDIGKELGVTDGNVRVIRYRAIERLRGCMTSVQGLP
jgi:RNA polymerase sigma-70 factor (ECF subfamily)